MVALLLEATNESPLSIEGEKPRLIKKVMWLLYVGKWYAALYNL